MAKTAAGVKKVPTTATPVRKRTGIAVRLDLQPTDHERATRLAKERSQLAQTLAGHEEKWLTMSAEYEEGTAE